MVDITEAKVFFASFELTVNIIVYIILHGKMSSSDNQDTNTSNKSVSRERNREHERDSGVASLFVCWPCHVEQYWSEPVARKAFIFTEPDNQNRLLYKL